MHVQGLLIATFFTLALAVEVPHLLSNVPSPKPELSEHIQALINNHINQVLQHVKQQQQQQQQKVPHSQTTTLVGQVPQMGTVASSVVPPTNSRQHQQQVPLEVQHAVQQVHAHIPQVINHQATATLVQRMQPGSGTAAATATATASGTGTGTGTAVVQNKAVPLPHIVVSLPGQAPLDIADKVNKLQQHVNLVMQQAQKHIPQAINHAIRERQKQAKSSSTTTTTTTAATTTTTAPLHVEPMLQAQALRAGRALSHPTHHWSNNHNNNNNNVLHVLHLSHKHLEQEKLGKCNFQCPRQSLPVCASNGKCVVEFPGQCELSKWNCFNTNNIFRQVHDSECQDKGTIRCYNLDNMRV
ncbi:uncharacterized protein LOC115632938 [Scaptodrosophila lebanonensis]|uniref:Uncharacterized protein LOC115632938 n=1 Tax=Drosophila lebanonensis TaxID=7225 RepID=A0A6J2UFA7_DROLE|nr:uncharacterized protein LOC115632938 [Scaptodrosophila lebanonensis]